jgi:hypothetical protein
MQKAALLALTLLISSLLGGCMLSPLRGGHSRVTRPEGTTELVGPQNPKESSQQQTESEDSTEIELPAGTPIHIIDLQGKTNAIAVLPQPTKMHTVRRDKTATTIGAAQKDMAREVGAKLASMRWMQWVGIAVFLFGAASLFYPPLKLIVGSVTTSLAATGAGLLLITLPVLIVGNEVLLLVMGCIIPAGVAVWFFAHRHGSVQSELRTVREFIDKNNDGIDDRDQ